MYSVQRQKRFTLFTPNECEGRSERTKGFTLVELLVVVAIIGVLAAVGLVMYSGAQKSGRIAKRIQDLKAIQTALELYNSVNKSYPTTSRAWYSQCANGGSRALDQVIPGLVPTYMVAFPADPKMDAVGNTSCYRYNSDGIDYKVQDYIISEFNQADYQNQKNLIDPNADGGVDPCKIDPGSNIIAWAVYSSPTSGCW